MDIKRNKENLTIIILTLVLILSSSLLLSYFERKAPQPYSSDSTEKDGSKGAYLLLQSLGFSIMQSRDGLKEIKSGSVIILIEPSIDYTSLDTLEGLNKWVYHGNTLVLAGNHEKYFTFAPGEDTTNLMELSTIEFDKDSDISYMDISYGSGKYRVIPDTALFTNGGLADKGNATKLVSALWDFNGQQLLFLEKNPGSLIKLSSSYKGSPLLLLGTTWQLILFQFLLGIMLLLFLTGRVLGKPIPFNEEEKRAENEDIIALSALLEQANLRFNALALYYSQFEKEASSYFKTKISGDSTLLENLWNQNDLKYIEKLKKLHYYTLPAPETPSNKEKVRLSGEDMVQLFKDIDTLREEIKK